MKHLACSSGAQFEDLPPSAVEESPGTPARLRSLRPLINSSGLVRYGLLVEDPSLLLHNVAVVQDYAELDWGSKENSARNIAFYCNAYNIWSMYLAFKKMRKHGLAWKGMYGFDLPLCKLPCGAQLKASIDQLQSTSCQACCILCTKQWPDCTACRANYYQGTKQVFLLHQHHCCWAEDNLVEGVPLPDATLTSRLVPLLSQILPQQRNQIGLCITAA